VGVHDGVWHDGRVWFTTVDGHIVSVGDDPTDVRRLRVGQGTSVTGPLGWCRGLAIVDGAMWVGMTRLRATTARRHLAWVRAHLRGTQGPVSYPTRLMCLDGRTIELESLGMDAVFGLLVTPSDLSPQA
jgi:hypothetical protein